MAGNNAATSEADVRGSVSSLYANILNQRKADRAERHKAEEEAKAARKAEKEAAKYNENGERKTKKEQRDAEFEQWMSAIVGLTGDNLEYAPTKKKGKKKYSKWIGDEIGDPMKPKDKKPKKKNFRKEFQPEMNMLRTLLASQNRLGDELYRRFQNMAGPATKDAAPLNKTLVDMIATINTSRSNSLAYLNAISGIKKTVAELYFKQLKEEGKGDTSAATEDKAITGSRLASCMIGDNAYYPVAGGAPIIQQPGAAAVAASSPQPMVTDPMAIQAQSMIPQGAQPVADPLADIQEFDPKTWDGEGLEVTPEIANEAIPHTVMLEWNRATGERRFVAVNDVTGEDMPGCPVPTSDPYQLKINEKDLTVKGEFDQSFKVRAI